MLCKKCRDTNEVVRGVKQIKCLNCYKETIVSANYNAQICHECSDDTLNCIKCGALIEKHKRYKVITLCGSTKFKDEFIEAQQELTFQGNIVISVGLFGHADGLFENRLTDNVKIMLDDMHKRKIDMADEIYVINKNDYIGKSTRSEIEYAIENGKKVNYMFEHKGE